MGRVLVREWGTLAPGTVGRPIKARRTFRRQWRGLGWTGWFAISASTASNSALNECLLRQFAFYSGPCGPLVDCARAAGAGGGR